MSTTPATAAESESNILTSVPVIDIAPLLLARKTDNEKSSIFQKCLSEIGTACKEWGFFYIANHGVSQPFIDKFHKDMDEFFHLPSSQLEKIRRNKTNSRGYFDDELTKTKLDWKRGFDFGAQDGSLDNEGMDGFNQWPLKEEHETFETTMRDYFGVMETLSDILLGAITQTLGLDSAALKTNFHGNHTSYLRLNYYPLCPDPESYMAIHHHTDAGSLTILYQDDSVTSLQVFRNEKWHFIPPREGTYVINIGDMIQVWSNDLYKAPLHRVQANSSTERYSAPFFYNPSYNCDVAPLELASGKEEEESRPVYKIVNWGEFRSKRFAGDFADVGEEVQISHYRQ